MTADSVPAAPNVGGKVDLRALGQAQIAEAETAEKPRPGRVYGGEPGWHYVSAEMLPRDVAGGRELNAYAKLRATWTQKGFQPVGRCEGSLLFWPRALGVSLEGLDLRDEREREKAFGLLADAGAPVDHQPTVPDIPFAEIWRCTDEIHARNKQARAARALKLRREIQGGPSRQMLNGDATGIVG